MGVGMSKGESVVYTLSDTVSVTTNPVNHSKSLTDSFSGLIGTTDTYDNSNTMSVSGSPSAWQVSNLASGTNTTDGFSNTTDLSGKDQVWDYIQDSASVGASGQNTVNDSDEKFSDGSDTYHNQSTTSETTTRAMGLPMMASGGTNPPVYSGSASCGYASQSTSTDVTSDTVDGSDEFADSSTIDSATGTSGSTASDDEQSHGDGSDTFSDSQNDTSATSYTTPGGSGATSDSSTGKDNGSDEYQFRATEVTSQPASGAATDNTSDNVSEDGSDQYSGTNDDNFTSQSAGTWGSFSDTTFDHGRIQGSDEYDGSESDTGSAGANGAEADQVDGDGSDQYSDSAGSNVQQTTHSGAVPGVPNSGTTVVTSDVNRGTIGGNDEYNFDEADTETEVANAKSDTHDSIEKGDGGDTYTSDETTDLGIHFVGPTVPGGTNTSDITDDGTSDVGGNDQYDFDSTDDSTYASNGNSSDDVTDENDASGGDHFTLTDASTNDTIVISPGPNQSGAAPAFGGLSLPTAIAGGGSIHIIDDVGSSKVTGDDHYTDDEKDSDDRTTSNSGAPSEVESKTEVVDVNGNDTYQVNEDDAETDDHVSLFGDPVGSLPWGIPTTGGAVNGSGIVSLNFDSSKINVGGDDQYDDRETDTSASAPSSASTNDVLDQDTGSGEDTFSDGSVHSDQALSQFFGTLANTQVFSGSRNTELDVAGVGGHDEYHGDDTSDDNTASGNTTDTTTDEEVDDGSDTYQDIDYFSAASQAASQSSGPGGQVSTTNNFGSVGDLGSDGGNDTYHDVEGDDRVLTTAGGGSGDSNASETDDLESGSDQYQAGDTRYSGQGSTSTGGGGNYATLNTDRENDWTGGSDGYTARQDDGTSQTGAYGTVNSNDDQSEMDHGQAAFGSADVQKSDTVNDSPTMDLEKHGKNSTGLTGTESDAEQEDDASTAGSAGATIKDDSLATEAEHVDLTGDGEEHDKMDTNVGGSSTHYTLDGDNLSVAHEDLSETDDTTDDTASGGSNAPVDTIDSGNSESDSDTYDQESDQTVKTHTVGGGITTDTRQYGNLDMGGNDLSRADTSDDEADAGGQQTKVLVADDDGASNDEYKANGENDGWFVMGAPLPSGGGSSGGSSSGAGAMSAGGSSGGGSSSSAGPSIGNVLSSVSQSGGFGFSTQRTKVTGNDSASGDINSVADSTTQSSGGSNQTVGDSDEATEGGGTSNVTLSSSGASAVALWGPVAGGAFFTLAAQSGSGTATSNETDESESSNDDSTSAPSGSSEDSSQSEESSDSGSEQDSSTNGATGLQVQAFQSGGSTPVTVIATDKLEINGGGEDQLGGGDVSGTLNTIQENQPTGGGAGQAGGSGSGSGGGSSSGGSTAATADQSMKMADSMFGQESSSATNALVDTQTLTVITNVGTLTIVARLTGGSSGGEQASGDTTNNMDMDTGSSGSSSSSGSGGGMSITTDGSDKLIASGKFKLRVGFQFTGTESQQSSTGSESASDTESADQNESGGDNFDAQSTTTPPPGGSKSASSGTQSVTTSESDAASVDAYSDDFKDVGTSSMTMQGGGMSYSDASNFKELAADLGDELTDDQSNTGASGSTTDDAVDDASNAWSDSTKGHDDSSSSSPAGSYHSTTDGNGQAIGSTSDDTNNVTGVGQDTSDDKFEHSDDSRLLNVFHSVSTSPDGYGTYDDTNTTKTDFADQGDDETSGAGYDFGNLVYDMAYHDHAHSFSVNTRDGSWFMDDTVDDQTDDEVGGSQETAIQPAASGTQAVEAESSDFDDHWESYTPYYGLHTGEISRSSYAQMKEDVGEDGAGAKDGAATEAAPATEVGASGPEIESFVSILGSAMQQFDAAQASAELGGIRAQMDIFAGAGFVPMELRNRHAAALDRLISMMTPDELLAYSEQVKRGAAEMRARMDQEEAERRAWENRSEIGRDYSEDPVGAMVASWREQDRINQAAGMGVFGRTMHQLLMPGGPAETGLLAASPLAARSAATRYGFRPEQARVQIPGRLPTQTPNALVGGWNSRLPVLWSTFNKLADEELLPKYRAIDPSLKWGYVGSFKNGISGNPNRSNYGEPFNLNEFDVDFWIESDVLFELNGDRLQPDAAFRDILSKTPGFGGLRPGMKGFSILFKESSSE